MPGRAIRGRKGASRYMLVTLLRPNLARPAGHMDPAGRGDMGEPIGGRIFRLAMPGAQDPVAVSVSLPVASEPADMATWYAAAREASVRRSCRCRWSE